MWLSTENLGKIFGTRAFGFFEAAEPGQAGPIPPIF
jgi:hypothetical protein